jgi:RNA polymerase sigma factor (sigma-70 family)
MEREEKAAVARTALEELSERDQEVLLLWDAGLSYTEIAERTGLAVGAIGTTLSRARRRLASAYEEMEDRNVARG